MNKGAAKHLPKRLQAFWRRRRGQILETLFCLIAATGFVLVFSESTSPIYSDYYSYGGIGGGGDSLQFQTVGKGWTEGLIPYKDLFDHKGPLIFLIDALGFLIGFGERYGIVIFQIIALFIVLKFVFKFAALASKRRIWGVVSSLIFLIFYSYCYVSGNSVQEYNLPFVMAACYFAVKFLTGPAKAKHPPKYALLYGICAGACLMTQATNAILIAAMVLMIGLVLLYRRHFVNFWQNVGAGLAGVLIIVLPFIIYFAANGALADMLYTVFIYNFEYTENIPSWLSGVSGSTVTTFLLRFLPYVLLPVIAYFAYRRGQKAYAGALIIAFLLESYLYHSTQSFAHYAIPALPQILPFINELLIWWRSLQKAPAPALELRFVWVGMVAVLSMLCYDITINRISNRVDLYQGVRGAGVADEYAGYESLMENYALTQDENGVATCSTFTAIGHSNFKGIYLRYGLLPYNKYFVMQRWHASYSETTAADIAANFSENTPACVLVHLDYFEASLYQPTLDESYTILAQNDEYVLYKRKQNATIE